MKVTTAHEGSRALVRREKVDARFIYAKKPSWSLDGLCEVRIMEVGPKAVRVRWVNGEDEWVLLETVESWELIQWMDGKRAMKPI